ncbi:MAG: heme lyase CcmF/NrfE family subunit [Rickettsiales bacterium]
MHANLAQLGLILSILIAFLIPLGFIWLNRLNKHSFTRILENIILFQCIFISFAFISLSYAYISSDFSLYNVARNSHIAIPLIFKISGVWSNHEGSMLLWVFLLSLVNYIFTNHKISSSEKIWIYTVQIIITSSLLSYTILKSNPFIKIYPVPEQGNGFNPLLQDIGLAIHPPILYLGYITTLIAFAISIAALMKHQLSSNLLNIMHKWSLLSWSFLSLGVGLGSWWAYRELGWGGYWFWDPVENASLLPWLTSTALIHSIYVTKKLNTNYKWTILLALFTFLLSILATFLVRSGVITSVHSFANDPNRGIFILKLLSGYALISLGIFAFKIHHFQSNKETNWLSRFGGINIANIFWVIATSLILLSLLYPLLTELYRGDQISVAREFFETTFIPVLFPILLLLALTLPATWKNILPVHYKHFTYSFIISSSLSIIFYFFSSKTPSLIVTGAFSLGCLVAIRMTFWFIQRMASPLSFKFYLIWLSHLTVGLFAMNIAFTETNSQELLVNMHEGDKIQFIDFNINYIKKENQATLNYLAGSVVLNITKNNNEVATLTPQIRYYPVEKKQTSESSIYHNIYYDLYAVISEITENGDVSIKLYYKPLISWLWLIFGILFSCGILLLIKQKKEIYASPSS